MKTSILNLKNKILFVTTVLMCLVILLVLGLVAFSAFEQATGLSFREAEKEAQNYSAQVTSLLDKGMIVAEVLATQFASYDAIEPEKRRSVFDSQMKSNLAGQPDLLGIWAIFEPNALDNLDSQFTNRKDYVPSGQFVPYWYRENDQIHVDYTDTTYTQEGDGDYYQIPKRTGEFTVIDPYLYPIQDKQVLMTSLVVPMKRNGTFIGAVGTDYAMDKIISLLDKVRPYETGYAALISYTGTIAAHPNKEFIGKNLNDTDIFTKEIRKDIIQQIQSGKKFSYDYVSPTNKKTNRYFYVPITIGASKTPWAMVISIPHDKVTAKARAMLIYAVITGIVGIIISILILTFLLVYLFKPIKQFIHMLKDVAEGEGDLTHRINVSSQDEIGVMAFWFNTFIEKIQTTMKQVAETVSTLNSSSEKLTSVSQGMLSGVDKVVSQSISVDGSTSEVSNSINSMASASEQMSVNANEIAGATEEMSQNANSVSASVEELSVSIDQVSNNLMVTSQISQQANSLSSNATTKMSALGEGANEIGGVTEVIKRIAEQTNLLALNATIEAASAGDAGKGFSVVANEIKELANQSAQAADSIADRITGVQSNTTDAVQVITEVSTVIAEVESAISNIAQAIEQQTRAANDISSSVSQASYGASSIANSIGELAKGTNDISINAGNAAAGVSEVAENISGIRKEAEDTRNGAQQVDLSSKELKQIANSIHELVTKFKL